MAKYIKFIPTFLFLIFFAALALAQTPSGFPEISFSPEDRVLILAPHPDDETIACAGVIQRARSMNIPVEVVLFTAGDNNQWSFLVYRKHPVFFPKAVQNLGLLRYAESIVSGAFLGIPEENIILLGYPDFKTLNIWYANWGDNPPVKSLLTNVRAVPYKNAFRPGAAYKGDDILRDLKTIIREFKPTKIFVSHPADHNPDHRSLYLFCRVALWDLEGEVAPQVFPYLVHFKNWPKPSAYRPEMKIIPPAFFKNNVNWQELALTAEQIKNKTSAVEKHNSQYKSSKNYLLSFVRSNELFGDYPVLKLRSSSANEDFLISEAGEEIEIPEQLENKERVSFVGLQSSSVHVEKDQLVIKLEFSRPLGRQTAASLHVFGYRHDREFSQMPKIHVKYGMLWYKIFDQTRQLRSKIFKVVRKNKQTTVYIPLKVLGDPEKILIGSHTYLGAVPLDWVAWRAVEIN